MSKVKVLICGATGFVGRNLLERLAGRADLDVTGTYFGTAAADLPAGRLQRVDLTNKEQVEAAVRGMDVIIQAAAVTSGSRDIVTRPYIHVTDNAVMNSLIFRAAFHQKVKHVVFFSCTTMYSPQPAPVKEEDFNGEIIDKYFGVGWTKVYIEKLCEFYARLGPTRYTAIRHSNIYGPYDKFDLDRSHVFGATMTKVMTNTDGTLTVWGDGKETRDLLYVSDLVDFVETILKEQADPYELINLGCGASLPIGELVQKIIAHSGKKIAIRYDTSKPSIPFNITLDIGKARRKYRWQPKVSLEEGIEKTLAWYRREFAGRTPG